MRKQALEAVAGRFGDGDTRGFLGLSTDDGTNIRLVALLAAAWFGIFAIPVLLAVPELPPTGVHPGAEKGRITEQTPLDNPFWEYSQKKAQAEALLFEAHSRGVLPVTVVRPSHTYRRRLPSALGGGDWTARRLLDNRKVIVHGDGTSLWTVTHASDFARPFVRLLGNPRALGEAFHITGENVHTWAEIFAELGRALGVSPRIVHVASDTLVRYEPAWKGPLHGDKAPSTLFDNAKVRAVAGEFPTSVSLKEGFAAAAREVRRRLERGAGLDPALDAKVDRIIAEQERAAVLS